MDDLRPILDQLEDVELDYVFERARQKNDAQAYKAAGIPKSTFYGWSEARRAELNDLAQRLKRRAVMRAQLVLEESAEKAAKQIVDTLDSESKRLAFDAARDILDRVAGRPRQMVDLSSGGDPIKAYIGISPDDWDEDLESDPDGEHDPESDE